MKKEKKQLRELSEEDLKKVTGGYVQFVKIDDGDLEAVLKWFTKIIIGYFPADFLMIRCRNGVPLRLRSIGKYAEKKHKN